MANFLLLLNYKKPSGFNFFIRTNIVLRLTMWAGTSVEEETTPLSTLFVAVRVTCQLDAESRINPLNKVRWPPSSPDLLQGLGPSTGRHENSSGTLFRRSPSEHR